MYCTVYFQDLDVMISSICLPVANGSIGGDITMTAEVRSVVDPATGNDLGLWMEMNMGGCNKAHCVQL